MGSGQRIVGVTLLARNAKEITPKQSKLRVIEEEIVCPAKTLRYFVECIKERRTRLSSNHTLFLTYIEDDDFSKISSVKDKTVAQWITNSLTATGIGPDKFTAHSIRATASIYAVQQGASIQEVKVHANWSLNAVTFEKYYLRPANRRRQGQMISKVTLEDTEKKNHIRGWSEPHGNCGKNDPQWPSWQNGDQGCGGCPSLVSVLVTFSQP
ncbi:hypothetical protein RMCBS344292_09004 [Rhizopus microsporus]|nr:hypothetical protein RMCBS344292_09004 [Rhizopus microsporus]